MVAAVMSVGACKAARMPAAPPISELAVGDFVKLRCDRAGNDVVLAWRGLVFAVVPGEPLRHVFTIRGMNIARCLRHAGAWHLTSRELMYYLAPDDESVLDRWTVPWTGESVPVVHVANRLVQHELGRPIPAQDDGTNVTIAIDVPLFYPNALASGATRAFSPAPNYQAVEMFTFTTPSTALRDATSSVSSLSLAWHRIGPWLPWMNMGERPGYLVYTAFGRKVEGVDALDEPLRSAVRGPLALYRHAPRCVVASANETSWTYFARHLSQYLAGARFPLSAPDDQDECTALRR